jgi:hypothetical protein
MSSPLYYCVVYLDYFFQVTEMATQAFFRYGGDPKYNFDATMGVGMGASTLGPNLGMTLGTDKQSELLCCVCN